MGRVHPQKRPYLRMRWGDWAFRPQNGVILRMRRADCGVRPRNWAFLRTRFRRAGGPPLSRGRGPCNPLRYCSPRPVRSFVLFRHTSSASKLSSAVYQNSPAQSAGLQHPKGIAERTRFELVVRNDPYVGLANRWFQPLTHLSGSHLAKLRHEGGLQSYEKNPICK